MILVEICFLIQIDFFSRLLSQPWLWNTILIKFLYWLQAMSVYKSICLLLICLCVCLPKKLNSFNMWTRDFWLNGIFPKLQSYETLFSGFLWCLMCDVWCMICCMEHEIRKHHEITQLWGSQKYGIRKKLSLLDHLNCLTVEVNGNMTLFLCTKGGGGKHYLWRHCPLFEVILSRDCVMVFRCILRHI